MAPLTVVGICSYHPTVHRWLGTLREHFDGPCLLYLTNPPPGVADALAQRYAATVFPTHATADFWQGKPVGTLCEQWRYLRDACLEHIRDGFVLRTDVWDVVFQDDPRRHIDSASRKIVASWEGPTITEQPQNRTWVYHWLPHFSAAAVVNGGLICGHHRSIGVLAALISQSPLETHIDQSELELLAAAFPDTFEHRPGFLECMYQGLDRHGIVADGRVCDRVTLKPWCVAHANGPWHKDLLNKLYPPERYAEG